MEIIGMEANAYEKSIRELNQFLDLSLIHI